MFLERKKDRENRPVINLKHLNQFIPYQHFKIKGLFYRREMLRKDENVQTGHEECLLFSTTSSNLNKICQIFMVRKPLRVSLTMFWLRPSTSNFLKASISVLRRINIPVIIYLDSMLLMGQTMKETLMSRDTTIFPLQHLGFIVNMDKSILQFYCHNKR